MYSILSFKRDCSLYREAQSRSKSPIVIGITGKRSTTEDGEGGKRRRGGEEDEINTLEGRVSDNSPPKPKGALEDTNTPSGGSVKKGACTSRAHTHISC